MTSWQVQEAKQRFSEVLRAAESDGPQIITRHGKEVAVLIDVEEFHRLQPPKKTFAEHLLSMPKMDEEEQRIFEEIEAERKRDYGRPPIDFDDVE